MYILCETYISGLMASYIAMACRQADKLETFKAKKNILLPSQGQLELRVTCYMIYYF